MRSTFRILFYVNRLREKNGLVPIMGRISFNGTISQFSCKCSVRKELWNQEAQKAIGFSIHAEDVNTKLQRIKGEIVHSQLKLSLQEKYITAAMIKNTFLHIANDYKTLLEAVDKDILEFRRRVGTDRSSKTLQKMEIVASHLKKFIRKHYRSNDIPLTQLDLNFIQSFSRYLMHDCSLSQSTIWVYCTYLKKIANLCCLNGTLKGNPFHQFRISPNVKERAYLTEEEISILIKASYNCPQQTLVRDIFIFSCFTGLSFIDTIQLTTADIKYHNGETWIFSKRKKTQVPFCIKLLSIASTILKKYTIGDTNSTQTVFPLNSYSKARRLLKQIDEISGLNKHLTYHIARHTFATLALTHGMPIETVSKILGHTNITTTQIYAKVIFRKIDIDFSNLEQRLNKIMPLDKNL